MEKKKSAFEQIKEASLNAADSETTNYEAEMVVTKRLFQEVKKDLVSIEFWENKNRKNINMNYILHFIGFSCRKLISRQCWFSRTTMCKLLDIIIINLLSMHNTNHKTKIFMRQMIMVYRFLQGH